jgi:hypothetical protein
VAQQYDQKIDTFNNVNFNMSYLQDLGNEAGLIGKVTSMKEGETAGPIKGINGVYVVQVIHRTEASISPISLRSGPNLQELLALGLTPG